MVRPAREGSGRGGKKKENGIKDGNAPQALRSCRWERVWRESGFGTDGGCGCRFGIQCRFGMAELIIVITVARVWVGRMLTWVKHYMKCYCSLL